MMSRTFLNLLPMAALLLVGGGCPAGPVGATGDLGAEGAPGKNALVATSVEAPGGSCGDVSGVQVTAGVDANGNGALDPSEVDDTQTRYICDGAKGDTGSQGIPGQSGVTVAEVAAQLPSNTTFVGEMAGALEGESDFVTAVDDIAASAPRYHWKRLNASTGAPQAKLLKGEAGTQPYDGNVPLQIPGRTLTFVVERDIAALRVTWSERLAAWLDGASQDGGSTCNYYVRIGEETCASAMATAEGGVEQQTPVGYCSGADGNGFSKGDAVTVEVVWVKNDRSLECRADGGVIEALEIVE